MHAFAIIANLIQLVFAIFLLITINDDMNWPQIAGLLGFFLLPVVNLIALPKTSNAEKGYFSILLERKTLEEHLKIKNLRSEINKNI